MSGPEGRTRCKSHLGVGHYVAIRTNCAIQSLALARFGLNGASELKLTNDFSISRLHLLD